MSPPRSTKEFAGILVKDLCRYTLAIYGPRRNHRGNPPWIWVSNRHEQLASNPSGPGVRCDWQWGSELHACKVLPALGQGLMQRALCDWPIRFAPSPQSISGPKISFLFAQGGYDRLPQLQQTLRSVFAQTGVRIECIVADMSPEPIEAELPLGVKYIRVEAGHLPAGWYKAWAFNSAARQAAGDVLVFQDGDVCVPTGYGAELARTVLDEGYDVASIQRFLFYLDEASTQMTYWEGAIPAGIRPARVLQNWKGGTIALAREAFFATGGFDEGFVDWGGEDDEFFDRCGARRQCRYGFLPFIHLYHPPQPDRRAPDNLNVAQALPMRLAIGREERIAELRARDWGNLARPDPLVSYKEAVTAKVSVSATANAAP
jgi:hypothetical protein